VRKSLLEKQVLFSKGKNISRARREREKVPERPVDPKGNY